MGRSKLSVQNEHCYIQNGSPAGDALTYLPEEGRREQPRCPQHVHMAAFPAQILLEIGALYFSQELTRGVQLMKILRGYHSDIQTLTNPIIKGPAQWCHLNR
jgi:hypothetical protein